MEGAVLLLGCICGVELVKHYEHLTGLARRIAVNGPRAVFWLVMKSNGLPTFGYGWQAVFVSRWVSLTAKCGG